MACYSYSLLFDTTMESIMREAFKRLQSGRRPSIWIVPLNRTLNETRVFWLSSQQLLKPSTQRAKRLPIPLKLSAVCMEFCGKFHTE